VIGVSLIFCFIIMIVSYNIIKFTTHFFEKNIYDIYHVIYRSILIKYLRKIIIIW